MTAAEIITSLSSKNIVVKLQGDQLKIIAAKDSITRDIADLIRAKKPELIAHLSAANSSTTESELKGRTYSLRNGTNFTISDEDFDNMVEVFRMLSIMKTRLDESTN